MPLKSNLALDHLFHALSDSTRRDLLMKLVERPRSVTELARPYPHSLNAISKHLKVLEKAHLIQREKQGTRHQLTVNFEALIPAEKWVEIYRRGWQAPWSPSTGS